MNKAPKFIYLEGNIGSGKTTFFNKLKQHLNDVIFLEEPVKTWENIKDICGNNMIENYYSNQKKYAFPFQIMAYGTRLNLLSKTLVKYINSTIKPVLLSERSIYTDKHVFFEMLYDDKILEKQEKEIYDILFENNNMNKLDYIYLYVNTEPELCLERIKKRNRSGEKISLDYLTKCHKYHQKWFKHENTNNIIIIDGRDDFNDVNIMQKYVEKIREFIKNKSK